MSCRNNQSSWQSFTHKLISLMNVISQKFMKKSNILFSHCANSLSRIETFLRISQLLLRRLIRSYVISWPKSSLRQNSAVISIHSWVLMTNSRSWWKRLMFRMITNPERAPLQLWWKWKFSSPLSFFSSWIFSLSLRKTG